MATPTLALPGRSAVAGPLKQQLGRDDYIMRGALVALALWLVLTVLLPLWALLSKSFQAARRQLRRPRQLPGLLRQPGAGQLDRQFGLHLRGQHRDLRAAGLRLRLWHHADLHARPRPVQDHRPDPDPGALAPAGDQPGLSVRQPGPGQGAAVRRLDLRADRHRHRRGVLDLSARADHHHHRTGDLRRAALRGRRGAARQPEPDLLDGDHSRAPATG